MEEDLLCTLEAVALCAVCVGAFEDLWVDVAAKGGLDAGRALDDEAEVEEGINVGALEGHVQAPHKALHAPFEQALERATQWRRLQVCGYERVQQRVRRIVWRRCELGSPWQRVRETLAFIFSVRLSMRTRLSSCASCCVNASASVHPNDSVSSVVWALPHESDAARGSTMSERLNRQHRRTSSNRTGAGRTAAAGRAECTWTGRPSWMYSFGRLPASAARPSYTPGVTVSVPQGLALGCTDPAEAVRVEESLEEAVHVARTSLVSDTHEARLLLAVPCLLGFNQGRVRRGQLMLEGQYSNKEKRKWKKKPRACM